MFVSAVYDGAQNDDGKKTSDNANNGCHFHISPPFLKKMLNVRATYSF
jgi:hypothetical protein